MEYRRILQAQLGYFIWVAIFNKTQLKPIQTIIDQAYKLKIGLNLNFPTALLKGPQNITYFPTYLLS